MIPAAISILSNEAAHLVRIIIASPDGGPVASVDLTGPELMGVIEALLDGAAAIRPERRLVAPTRLPSP